MLEIMFAIMAFLSGFAFGWVLRRSFRELVDEVKQEIRTEKDRIKNTLDIMVEYHDNRFFVYEHKNGVFVCQGNTPKEVCDAFSHRYPEKIAHVVSGDLDAIEKIKTYLDNLED